jgi:hypothetical protein
VGVGAFCWAVGKVMNLRVCVAVGEAITDVASAVAAYCSLVSKADCCSCGWGVKYADQIIGIFEKWKPSVDGPDRYMVLKNPFNEELYSIRTTWKNENTSTTTILKEDLTQIMSTGPTQKYLKKIGPLEQNLNLFAKGRVVITNLDVNKDSQNNSMTYTSSDGSYRTAWLVIR